MLGKPTNTVEERSQLSRTQADAIAAQIRAIHPQADALVLYAFGSGGYVVVARSPLPGQDDVALLCRRAYVTFLNLRADAWLRAWDGKGSEGTMAERIQESAVATIRATHEQEGR